MKVKGREWDWWVIRNSHDCRFCNKSLGSIVRAETGLCQVDSKYNVKLYYVWLRHMKECHPDIGLERG